MVIKPADRRRHIRVEIPLKLKVSGNGWSEETVTSNVSPTGMRFMIKKEPAENDVYGLELYLAENELVKLKGRVVWRSRMSLEDNSPYDCGVEITEIEEKSKNTLLKFLCDLLYKTL